MLSQLLINAVEIRIECRPASVDLKPFPSFLRVVRFIQNE